MADIESNIGINIDTTNALASIKNLQRQISAFQKQMSASSATNASKAQDLQRSLINDLNASGKFSASLKSIRSTTESFTNSLEKNKLSMGEYFRYAGASTKTFGRTFSAEFNTIEKVARERVKTLQTQYISLGRDANGALQSIAVRPLSLDMNDLATKQALVGQKQQIFNQLLKQGSTNLLNFGKNTQWAGRQLMVGFTIPLSILGATAAKAFMDIEEQTIKFKRVYGDLFTLPEEADKMVDQLKGLGEEFTKYGVSVKNTLSLASEAAAMGSTGNALLAQVTESTRLAVLGDVSQSQALETSIALTNTFGIATEDLAKKIDFLNAVENQTVVSIDDLTIAIPKAGPVIEQLGGTVEDLAFFLTAMKEGGINASEGANALKSGLASLINPTQQASDMLRGFGINIRGIVSSNAGDVKNTVIDFAKALDELDPLSRAQAIEQLFGKFQFARVSTLFKNVVDEGTQASRVLELASSTTSELAQLSQKELSQLEQSSTYKFKGAIESFTAALAPIGEEFMKLVTPIIEFGTKVLKAFDNLGDGAKGAITGIIAVLGGVAPVALMTFGLFANGVANLIKGFAFVRETILGLGKNTTTLGEQTQYMTQEQLTAAGVAASLDQAHSKLIQTFTVERDSLDLLTAAYDRNLAASGRLSGVAAMPTSIGRNAAKKFASGGIVRGPGTGTSDSILSLLSNGEAVIPAKTVRENPNLIDGLISGKIQGFSQGGIAGQVTSAAGSYDVAGSQASLISIQKFVDAIESGAIKIDRSEEVLAQTLEGLAGSTKASLKEFFQRLAVAADEIAGQSVSNQVNKFYQNDMGKSGRAIRYSATGVGTIASQMEASGRSDELARARQRLAAEASLGLPGQIQIDRAHRLPVGSSGKLFKQAWAPEGYNPQTHSENAVSNALSGDNATSGFIDKYTEQLASLLKDSTISQQEYNSILEKAKNNLALSESELKIQGQVLSQIVDQEQEFLLKNEALGNDVSRVIAGSRVPGALLPGAGAATAQEAATFSANLSSAKLQAGGSAIAESVGEALIDSAVVNSPSKKTRAATDGMVAGVTEGISAAKDDVKAAMDNAVSDGARQSTNMSRRATREGGPVPGSSPYVPPQRRSGYRRASSPQQNSRADAEAAVAAATAPIAAGVAPVAKSFSGLTTKLMAASGAISAVSMTASLFGADLGAAGEIIFKLSNAMFGLTAVVEVLSRSTKIQAGLSAVSGAGGMSGIFKGAKGLSGALNGVKTLFSTFMGPVTGLMGIFIRLIPVIGAVFLAFQAFQFLTQLQEEQRKKISGLGDTAFLASEKMKAAADLLGFSAVSTSFAGQFATGSAAASSSQQQSQIDTLRASDTFKEDFKSQIDSVKTATIAQAEVALQSLAIQMVASGAPQESVDALVKAIAQEAGRSDLNLEFTKIDVSSAEGLASIKKLADDSVNLFNESFANGFKQVTIDTSTSGGASEQIDVVTDDLKKQAALLAGSYSSIFAGLKTGLSSGVVGAKDFVAQISDIESKLNSLSPAALKLIIPTIAKNLGIEEMLEGLEDSQYAITLISAAAAGMVIPVEDMNLFKKAASDDTDVETLKAARIRQDMYNKSVREGTLAKEADVVATEKVAQINADIEAARLSLQEQTQNMQRQTQAYNHLIDLGYDTQTAYDLASDAIVGTAVVAAYAGNNVTGDLAKVQEYINAFIEAKKALPKVPSGGGGAPQKSDFQIAIDSLKDQAKQSINTVAAFAKLRKAGFSVTDAFNAASESGIAAAVAASSVKSDNWKKLTSAIKAANSALQQASVLQILTERQSGQALQESFSKITPMLSRMGLDLNDISSILNDPDLARTFINDLEDGKINSQAVLDYINSIPNEKRVQILFDMSTPEGMTSRFQEAFDRQMENFSLQETKVNEKYSDQISSAEDAVESAQKNVDAIQSGIDAINTTISDKQRDIELSIDRPIEDLNSQIANIQRVIETEIDRPMGALQDESSALSHDLEIIDAQSASINEKYDAQEKALSAVADQQSRLQEQESNRLTIADALSKGDIAAAARAVQEERKAATAAAMKRAEEARALARDQKIEALRSESGMSRLEIDDRQKLIADQMYELGLKRKELEASMVPIQDSIYNLEQSRITKVMEIRDLEDKVFSIQNGQLKSANDILKTKQDSLKAINDQKQAELDSIDSQRHEWELLQIDVDTARITSDGYLTSLTKARDMVNSIRDAWALVNSESAKSNTGKIEAVASLPSSTVSTGSGQGDPTPTTGPGPRPPYSPGTGNYWKLVGNKWSAAKIPPKPTTTLPAGQYWLFNSTSGKWEKQGTATGGGGGKLLLRSTGGIVPKYFAAGGFARGTDTVPSMLTPGEFVVRRSSVQDFGVDRLKAINSGTYSGESVYNYSVNINVKSNANSDDIARSVMTTIRRVDSQRLKTGRF